MTGRQIRWALQDIWFRVLPKTDKTEIEDVLYKTVVYLRVFLDVSELPRFSEEDRDNR